MSNSTSNTTTPIGYSFGADLNSYQMAGLIGTTMSGLTGAYQAYTNAQMSAIGLNAQAGSTLVSGLLGSTQILLQSEMQAFNRKAEQEELSFNASMASSDIDFLKAQSYMVEADANMKATSLYSKLNNSVATISMNAVAQNRYGATVENIRRREYYKNAQNMELLKEQTNIAQANIAKQTSGKKLESELYTSAIGASRSYSTYETKSAQIQSRYMLESSRITAESLKSQAKTAKKLGNYAAGLGVASSVATLGIGLA